MTGASDGLPAVSLFSNCGAGDVGFAKAGFEFDVLAELDERRLSVAKLNLKNAEPVPGDLRETWPAVVSTYRARRGAVPPALLAACPPCQGMSSARSGRGRADDADAGSRDARNLLVGVIAQVALALRPRVVVVENVPAFLTRRVRHPQGQYPISAATLLVRRLRQQYKVSGLVADLADYGVPQARKRAFLCFVRRDAHDMASRLAERAPFPRPTHAADYGGKQVTLRQALGELNAGGLDAASHDLAGSGMHVVPVWEQAQYEMVAAIPPNSGSGAWANRTCSVCNEEAGEDDAACPSCGEVLRRPVVIEPDGSARLVKGFRTSSYSRMDPDRPAATITTASGHVGSDKTVHPWENRVLSPLECAYLQTFPQGFDWGQALKKWGTTNVRAMIGEAVPPGFTEQHGEVLAGLMTGSPTRPSIASVDQRVTRAVAKLADAERSARDAAKHGA